MISKFSYWCYITIIIIYQKFPRTLGALVHKIILFWISGIKLSDEGVCALKMVTASEGKESYCLWVTYILLLGFFSWLSIPTKQQHPHLRLCAGEKNWTQLWWEQKQKFQKYLTLWLSKKETNKTKQKLGIWYQRSRSLFSHTNLGKSILIKKLLILYHFNHSKMRIISLAEKEQSKYEWSVPQRNKASKCLSSGIFQHRES